MRPCAQITLASLFVLLCSSATTHGASVAVTFVPLTGVTGGSPAGTGVYRASLEGLGLASVQSITIQDASFGLGGATGQFSGFDLDAIILSNTSVGTAAGAAGLVGLAGFDYSPVGTLFTPGTQRPPPDPKLFGTGPGGTTVDNAVATLGAFDGNSTTAIPGAFGFVSMGDGGILSFNLAAPISTTGLYLYIGEVGDNGEVVAGTITISDTPVTGVPEPTTLASAALAGLVGLCYRARRRRAA